MKLSKKIINRIKEQRSEGKSIAEIAKKFEVSPNTVYYHTNELRRLKVVERSKKWGRLNYKKGRTWAQRNPRKVKAYMRKYMRERYQHDAQFRERINAVNIRSQQMRKLRGKKKV